MADVGMSPMAFLRQWQKKAALRLAFRARTRHELEQWQTALREKLRELLGLHAMAGWECSLDPREDPIEDVGTYTRQRGTIQTAPGYRMPLLVLRPQGEGPFAPVLAMHGHGNGKRDVCGLPRDASEAEWQDRVNYRYADDAVHRGYIVFAPDKRGFGEQAEDLDLQAGRESSCAWLNMSAMLLGLTEIGMHVWDNRRLIDYVETREDCRKNGLACLGVSGGGQAALWLAVMDERVSVAVVSGHLGSFASSILLTDGCTCNTVPGLLLWAEKGDVAGLIAPRPLLIESGSEDGCYSRTSQLEAYRIVERVYTVAHARDRLDIDLYEGPHQWSGRKAWDWLQRWLK